ncbi:MAG TPA: glycosyltransferase family 2 protein [Candidatus Nanoarchaeia archaeon]|nr:glycosyltransferase family 2 protein [Candidatus Nanoarchaeia archaeon]
MNPLVSAVIVNYNGKEIIETAIDTLMEQGYRQIEIIVIDNDSTDGSREMIKRKYKTVKLVKNRKNLGYCGINLGLSGCKGKYILFLNNDIRLDKNCVNELVKTAESNKDVAMVAPRLINFYDKNLKSGGTWLSRAFYNGHIKGSGKETKREIPYLGVGMIRKDFVDMFGYLFDNDYFIYGEDVDLGLRIRLAGKKIMFEPKSVMYHMHSTTMQKKSKSFSTFLMERNLITTFFKIFSLNNLILYLPYVLFFRLIAIVRDILALRFDLAFARLQAIFSVLFNFSSIIKKRKETQKFRKVSDDYILKVFSEVYLFKEKFNV